MECKLPGPGRYIDDSAIDSPGWVHILLGMCEAAGKVWWWVIECRLHMQRDCMMLLLNTQNLRANEHDEMCSRIAGADAMVALVQNRKEGLLVLLMKQHKTMLSGHDMGEINQHIHRQGKKS